MSFIIEPAFSALFEVLFLKLGSQEFLNFARRHQVEAEINRWATMLATLRAVLEDAEQKQLASRAVKGWLEDLQHLAYDVEDVLDEFSYGILHRKVKAKNQSENRTYTSMVRNLTPEFISVYTPKSLLFNSKMASKLEKITSRLQELIDRKRQLDLLENVGAGASRRVWSRPPSSSVPNEPIFIGRDTEKRRIIELLMRHEQGDARIGVIPITGMGGLGKTALARSVYNDDIVKGSFEKIIWVCVSQDYDVTRITRGILEAVTSQPCNFRELSLIQAKLHEALLGKRFLLVLDDLWNENYGDWDVLRSPLMHGAPGSKVIVTTRLVELADMTRTVACEPLGYMSDDECWLIFCSHAFDWNGNSPTNSRFEEIGRKIVRKCSGLPLVAMTLGGLLRSKVREEDWESVLNNKLWSFKDEKVDVLSVLRMSYYDLPSHLKRCFAYCAIFPEDFKFEEDKLVVLWMAEGLIQPKQSGDDEKNIEDMGHNYFHDLISRSLFLPLGEDGCQYVMHDLVHDLSVEVAGLTCYKVEKDAHSPNQVIRERARHSTFIRGRRREFNFLGEMQLLRSILPLPWERRFFYEDKVPQNAIIAMLSKLKYLRVLSFHGYEDQILELPKSIGNSIHLRYLDLSYTAISIIPSSTTSLYNLQTLLLMGCHRLEKLPQDIENLINLIHLDFSCTRVHELPPGIKELKNLKRLSRFIVGKGHGLGITSLSNLKFLQGELCISKLENVTSAEDAKSAALCDKKKLEALSLEWSHKRSSEANDGVVLEELQPHRNLKKLSVGHCRNASIPSWMGNLSMLQEIAIVDCPLMSGSLPLFTTSLKKLFVIGCPQLVVSLPRLSELSELQINGCKEVDCTEDASFESVNELGFSNITNVTPLVKDKFVEGMKHPKSLILITANDRVGEPPSPGTMPRWELENLPLVTSLMMDEQCALAQMKLEYLYLCGFQSLGKLPQWVCKTMSLNHLQDCGWPSLTLLAPNGHFSPTLKKLDIYGCGELTTILPGGMLLIGLEQLVVKNCSKLESIAERFDDDMRSLKVLKISGCPSLKKLPDGMHGLTSLKELSVKDCQGLDPIPGGDLPTNLVCLEIFNNNIVKPLLEWGLHRLPRLFGLSIGGYLDAVCFPPEEITGMTLPQSLTDLRINDFQDLEYLTSRSLQDLGSLEFLTVRNCPKLAIFPDGCLPPSLKALHIENCPLLKQNCLSTGWSSISRIPHVSIDGNLVSESGNMRPGYRPQKKSCLPWFG